MATSNKWVTCTSRAPSRLRKPWSRNEVNGSRAKQLSPLAIKISLPNWKRIARANAHADECTNPKRLLKPTCLQFSSLCFPSVWVIGTPSGAGASCVGRSLLSLQQKTVGHRGLQRVHAASHERSPRASSASLRRHQSCAEHDPTQQWRAFEVRGQRWHSCEIDVGRSCSVRINGGGLS